MFMFAKKSCILMTHLVLGVDTIYAESEVLGNRESKSRPDQALLYVKTRATNQHEEDVCSFERQC